MNNIYAELHLSRSTSKLKTKLTEPTHISIGADDIQTNTGWKFSIRKAYRLTTGKNEKVDSLHVHAKKNYREEADGIKSFSYTSKITIFVNMWNLGQFR